MEESCPQPEICKCESRLAFACFAKDAFVNRSACRGGLQATAGYLRHVLLDFENGELRPEELPNLFPGLRIAITNTITEGTIVPDTERHEQPSAIFRLGVLTAEVRSSANFTGR